MANSTFRKGLIVTLILVAFVGAGFDVVWPDFLAIIIIGLKSVS